MEGSRGKRKTLIGRVLSNKMDKTVVVEVTRRVLHPRFRKYVTRRKRYMAHDEANECAIGDSVLLTESRPLSRLKRWRVTQRWEGSAKAAPVEKIDEL